MQVDFKNENMSEEEKSKLRKKLGFADDPIPFDAEHMKEALEHPEVGHVRVFHLEKGMTVDIGGHKYKVITVRSNGKITIRKLKS